MNFTTKIPKDAPEAIYLVATGKSMGKGGEEIKYRMHAVVQAHEYDMKHTLDDVSQIKAREASEGRIKPRVILCHVMRIEGSSRYRYDQPIRKNHV